MATIDQYKIQMEVTGEAKVKSLTKAVDGLGTTLAGIGFTAFIANAFRMADAMNDIADATGLTAGYVKGLGNALQQAGGDMQDVGSIVNKFYQNVDDLANGSDKAADAFGKLGIKGSDLLKLSRQDVLGLTLKRLSEMGPSAERTALGIEIFGKAFGKIDPKKLDEILKKQDFAKLDVEIRKAGEAYGAMEANILTLQQAVLATFTPLIGDMDNMRLSAEQAEKIIKTLALTFALAFGAKTLVNIIEITKAIRQMAVVSSLLGKNPVLKLLAGGALAVGVGAAIDKLMEAENIALPEVGGAGKAEQIAAATQVEATNREKAAKAAQQQTIQLRQQFEVANKFQRILNETLGLETNRANVVKALAQIEEEFANKKLALESQITAEKNKGKDSNLGIIDALTQQLLVLDQQEQISKKLTLDAIERNRLEQERISLIDYNVGKVKEFYELSNTITEQFIRGIVNQGSLTEKQAAREIELRKAQAAMNEKLFALDAQLAKENDSIKKAILEKQLADVKKNEEKRIELIRNRFALEDELQQSVLAGSLKALNEIADGFKPYQMAQDAIMMTWGKIGSAIDTFIETGKFKFSDFARSILQDLAKMIAKALIFKYIFEPLMGALGLPVPSGRAAGGPVKGNTPYIVGEKGPELFVPPNAGSIIPNNKLTQAAPNKMAMSGPVTNNYNTYNISALDAKSVAQLFAENRKAIFGANKMAEREMSYAGVR